MKITPVLMVKSIEQPLPFPMERMVFEKTAEAPDGYRLAFAILVKGAAEVMLQTIESVRKDHADFAPSGSATGASLFIETDDFAYVLKPLGGYPIAMAERTTFYGMREIGVPDPDGHVAVFAAKTNAG